MKAAGEAVAFGEKTPEQAAKDWTEKAKEIVAANK